MIISWLEVFYMIDICFHVCCIEVFEIRNKWYKSLRYNLIWDNKRKSNLKGIDIYDAKV